MTNFTARHANPPVGVNADERLNTTLSIGRTSTFRVHWSQEHLLQEQ